MVSPNLPEGIVVSAQCLCRDHDTCAIIELNHLEPGFFSHPCAKTPICAETPICMCEDADDYGTTVTAVLHITYKSNKLWCV